MARHGVWLWVGVAVVLGGCTPMPTGFDSPEPAARIEAAVGAAEGGDRGAIPDLIGLLESDDPATRMVAIRSLERLTGETLGYGHAAPEAQREESIERWVEWYGQSVDGSRDAALSAPAVPVAAPVPAEPEDG